MKKFFKLFLIMMFTTQLCLSSKPVIDSLPFQNSDLFQIWYVIKYNTEFTPVIPFQNSDLYQIWLALMADTTGGGGVAGNGTINRLAMWTPDSTTLGDSYIYQATNKLFFEKPIYDVDTFKSLDVNTRRLYDSQGTPKISVGWDTRTLNDQSGTQQFFWGVKNGLGNSTPNAKLDIIGYGGKYIFKTADNSGNPIFNIRENGKMYCNDSDNFAMYFDNVNRSTYLGDAAGASITSGIRNTVVGFQSMLNTTTGSDNVAIGRTCLNNNISGGSNIAIAGYNALYYNTTGNSNVAIGLASMELNQTGSNNTAVGTNSLAQNTTGNINVAIGNEALFSNSTGYQNTAVGNDALRRNSTGIFNTAIGASALYGNTTGDHNTAIGDEAADAGSGRVLTGSYNTFLGTFSNYLCGTNDRNTCLGSQSGYMDTTGHGNIFLGFSSGYNESGNNILLVDDTIRSDSSSERRHSIIYGVMNNDSSKQKINFNATVKINYVPETSVNNSTSGNTTFSEPLAGYSYKKIIIYCNASLGTASYTFPNSFRKTPAIVVSSLVGSGVVTSLSSSAVTITGAATTGFIFLEGY